jgi:hypothetical protein
MIRRIAASGKTTDAQLDEMGYQETGMANALRDDMPEINGWKWVQQAASAAAVQQKPIMSDHEEDARDQPRPVRRCPI